MSVIATAVRHLMAAGVTGDALCDAVAELEAALHASKPRSAAAIRQERYREKKRNKASQVTESDGCDAPPLSPSPNENNSNPHPHTPGNNTRARKGRDDFPCPEWAEPEIWRDLKRNRKTKRLTNTPTAHKRFVEAVEGMADASWPPGRLLEAIVAKGWGGAHDPREEPRNRTNARQQPSNRNAADLTRAKLAALGPG